MAALLLNKAEQESLKKAIETAESCTSGEIRVHLESQCKGDPVNRAVYIFEKIGMHKTVLRNGVLIYLASGSRKLSIIGDSGINEKVPANFWQDEKDLLADYLKQEKAVEGLSAIISIIGNKLKEFFPSKDGGVNEQSNEISFSI